MENKEKAISNLEKELKKYEDNSFKLYFYVFDTEGHPSGTLEYIYETALTLKEMGYNVQMLYSSEDFVGVSEWLGSKYGKLPHKNVGKVEVTSSPSDIIFVPELYTNVMAQIKDMPCKKVVILQNTNYLCDTITPTATFETYKVYDCVTTSDVLLEKIKVWFPTLKTRVVRPLLPSYFEENEKPKKLIVNVVAKNQSDVNTLVKTFFWKYPLYKWVTFRDLRNVKREEFAKGLKESVATVWVDRDTDFGHVALEAMACKNIVIGKIPETEPEWLVDENGVTKDNGLWFYKYDVALDMIAGTIESYINNDIPEVIFNECKKTVECYREDNFKKNVKETYVDDMIEGRKHELEVAYLALKNNQSKESEKE